jgi:biopolymer transport protein ExbD
MKRPSMYLSRREQAGGMFTPLIDVVFLLLVFFVWTASFHVTERLLPSQLTALGTSGAPDIPRQPRDVEPVVIRIDWRGTAPGWSIDGTPVPSLADVRQTLEAVARIKSDVLVILDPDADVPLGNVIDVYDIARLQGFQQVQFTAAGS